VGTRPPWEITSNPPEIRGGIPILSTCRQIYHEALDALYGQNTFVVDGSFIAGSILAIDVTAQWLSSLDPALCLVRNVVIKFDLELNLCLGHDHWFFDYAVDLMPAVKVL
jgi:hypothetical protein